MGSEMLFLSLLVVASSFVSVFGCGTGSTTISRNRQVDALITYSLVQDVFTDVPDNVQLLTANWGNGAVANLGNTLTPTQTAGMPTLIWTADPTKYYTVIMTDPDAPSRANPTLREFVHWVRMNIPGSQIAGDDSQIAYVGPSPMQGTGLHRYLLAIYEQPGRIIPVNPIGRTTANGRTHFRTQDFAKNNKLKGPIAINFFQAAYDATSTLILQQLGIGK